MRRNCIKIEGSERIKLYVDEENAGQILSYCEQDEQYSKKYRYIKNALLRGIASNKIYQKVKNCEDIWEVRFFPNVKGRNDRIYCKQFDDDETKIFIIMVELYKGKKTQNIDKRIQSRLNEIKKYEYDIK